MPCGLKTFRTYSDAAAVPQIKVQLFFSATISLSYERSATIQVVVFDQLRGRFSFITRFFIFDTSSNFAYSVSYTFNTFEHLHS